MNVIASLDAINAVIGVDLLGQSLLPAVVELAQDSKWRVRLAIIENIPMMAKHFGVEFFNEKLISLCTAWLVDDIHSIRKASAVNMQKLMEQFGEEWVTSEITPKLEKMHLSTAYSQRMTCCYVLQLIMPGLSTATMERQVFPIITALAGDAVANIRFTVAKTIHAAVSVLRNRVDKSNSGPSNTSADSALLSKLHPILTMLSEDADRDVRFYAGKVSKVISSVFRDSSSLPFLPYLFIL